MSILQPNLPDYTENYIKLLIENGIEESITLEFKAADALAFGDKEKNEISKDVSAFANSGGGLIIYGIEELNHRASKVSPIDGNKYSKEWIEQIINSRIHQKIPGLLIHPVRLNDKIDESVYIIDIPESQNSPHMASDNRFYRRYNFQSVKMDEYEIRQLYSKTRKTQLKVLSPAIHPLGNTRIAGKLNWIQFKIGFPILNIGPSIEKYYKIEVWLPEQIYVNTDSSVNPISKFLDRKEIEHSVFSIGNTNPLFQNELVTSASCVIQVNKGGIISLSKTPLKYKLYFSNGIDSGEVDLSKELMFDGNVLSIDSFH